MSHGRDGLEEKRTDNRRPSTLEIRVSSSPPLLRGDEFNHGREESDRRTERIRSTSRDTVLRFVPPGQE